MLGVLLTGFVIMPKLGLRNAFLFLACGLAMTALTASWRQRFRQLLKAYLAVTVLLIAFMFVGNEGWRRVMVRRVPRAAKPR